MNKQDLRATAPPVSGNDFDDLKAGGAAAADARVGQIAAQALNGNAGNA